MIYGVFRPRWADSFTDYAHVRADSHREGRAPADDRRPLLHGDLPVLRRAHREALEVVLGGELGEAGKVGPRSLGVLAEGRHRHQPADPHRAALEERRQLAGPDPALP